MRMESLAGVWPTGERENERDSDPDFPVDGSDTGLVPKLDTVSVDGVCVVWSVCWCSSATHLNQCSLCDMLHTGVWTGEN